MSTPNRSTLPCGRPKPAPHELASHSNSSHANEHAAENDWKQRLEKYALASGLKHSEQRMQIAQVLVNLAGQNPGSHFGTQEIAKVVQKKFPNIGLATVYRNIKILCEAKVINETLVSQTEGALYELSDKDHHDHIVCTDCGHIFEFENKQIEQLQDKLTDALKFKPTSHRHVIYAKCQYAK